MSAEEKPFWVGITIFATLGGAGFYVVFDHPFWGSVFILLGILGLGYAIWERVWSENPRMGSSRYWVIALLLTWLMMAFVYYDRHFSLDAEIPEFDDSKVLVTYYGASAAHGFGFSELHVNGSRFFPYRDHYKLVAVCFVWDGLSNVNDAPHLQQSSAYDISNGELTLVIQWGASFAKDYQDTPQQLRYGLLMVPTGISPSQFGTIRQAKGLGARLVWGGGSGRVKY